MAILTCRAGKPKTAPSTASTLATIKDQLLSMAPLRPTPKASTPFSPSAAKFYNPIKTESLIKYPNLLILMQFLFISTFQSSANKYSPLESKVDIDLEASSFVPSIHNCVLVAFLDET